MLSFGLGVEAYDGPIAVGKPLPAFEAQDPDGKVFGRKELVARGPQLVIAFRGSW